MAAAASLSEPEVLALAKRRLFPEDDDPTAYAVVDTQFARAEWLPDQPIRPTTRDRLAPFNHVRLGTGYPDLVGVRRFDGDVLVGSDDAASPPLIAIEAKGHSGRSAVDVERGIFQAFDRLADANAAYVAVPNDAISGSARSLCRELNVGLLGVTEGGDVDLVEVPRVVGNRTSEDASAIRFQATAQGVANKSFSLNHPKNYLAYPLALYHYQDTDALLSERVVRAVDGARTGASFLGLIDERPGGDRLSPLGEEVVRFAVKEYGSADAALNEFESWQRSQKRFCDLAPRWGLLTRRIVWAYPATRLLVDGMQSLYDRGTQRPTLVEFVQWLYDRHPTFTVELFLKGSADVRSRALDEDGALVPGALRDGTVYHSPTVFQLKAILFHAGFVTERGAEPNRLDPTTDVWALREPL